MLRVLFFILLLVNVLVLIWQWGGGPVDERELVRVGPPADNVLSLAEGHQRAELVRETATEPSPVASPSIELQGCLLLGGLASESAMREVAHRLGMPDPELVTEFSQEVSAWWVLLPPELVEDQAQVAEALDAANLGDFFVIRSGDAVGGVSLGLFTAENRAERRRQRVEQAGFQAEIRERYEESARYWIQIPLGLHYDEQRISPGQPLAIRPTICPESPESLVGRGVQSLE